MTIQEIREINKKIDELSSCRKMLYNWCEDMNSATQLLEKMSEDVVAIQKYKGDWHVYHKYKGDWDAHHNNWIVTHKSLPMAICLAFIKWKENQDEPQAKN